MESGVLWPPAAGGLRAANALLQVLVQTFSALALGFFCARHAFVDVEGGDLRALQFFIARIALPLQVFKVVATGNIGSVDLGVILACNLGKVSVYVLTFGMSLCAYRSKENFGRRILTSAVMGFFTTASNDLAIGFPVITAIYGDTMSVYLAANVLVFQTIIQPVAIVILEIGQAMSSSSGPVFEGRDHWREVLLQVARSVAFNPIMIATVMGAVYSASLSFTLTQDADGSQHLPDPLGGVIQLWTSPFTMMFLFLNGTSLRSAEVALWPGMLALMKVVVCAYFSYGLSHIFVPESNPKAHILRDFTFFYGTIPAGGAPVIFAQHFDVAVNVLASASILGLILAAPVEFVTALFLGTVTGSVDYYDVREVMYGAAQGSAVCSGVFVLFLILGWWGGSFSSRAIGVYGCVTLVYEAWTLLLMQGQGCLSTGPLSVFRFLQNVCYILVVYMEYHLGTRWREGRRARKVVVVPIVLGIALAATILVPYGNTYHEMCGLKLEAEEAAILVAWNMALFLSIAAFAVRGRLLKQRAGGWLPARRRLARTLSKQLLDPLFGRGGNNSDVTMPDPTPLSMPSISPLMGKAGSEAMQSEPSIGEERTVATEEAKVVGLGGDGVAVAVCLIVFQGVRSFMGVINGTAQAMAVDPRVNERGFTPMLILADILEHGQGCLLLLAVIFQPGVLAQTRQVLVSWAACGFGGGAGPLAQLGQHALQAPLELYSARGSRTPGSPHAAATHSDCDHDATTPVWP